MFISIISTISLQASEELTDSESESPASNSKSSALDDFAPEI